jgi:DNA-directed RNA polymerase subunit RPC12/RpoP
MRLEHVPRLKCPKCGNSRLFDVESTTTLYLEIPAGSNGKPAIHEYQAIDIVPDGACRCRHCSYNSSTAAFRDQALRTMLSASSGVGDALHRVS